MKIIVTISDEKFEELKQHLLYALEMELDENTGPLNNVGIVRSLFYLPGGMKPNLDLRKDIVIEIVEDTNLANEHDVVRYILDDIYKLVKANPGDYKEFGQSLEHIKKHFGDGEGMYMNYANIVHFMVNNNIGTAIVNWDTGQASLIKDI